MKISTNPSSIRSKKEITNALLKLMETIPYNEITVKQIVLETNLVRKTFYRNFKSKDDVLNNYIKTAIKEYTDALTSGNDAPLSVIFDFCERNKKMLTLLDKNNLLHLLLLQLNENIPIISSQTNPKNNPFAKSFKGLDSDYLIAFNIGAIWNVLFTWVRKGMNEPIDNVQKNIEEYLVRMSTSIK